MTRIGNAAAGGLLGLFLLGLAPDSAAAAEPAFRARTATLASLFSDRDYPAEAIRSGEQGAVAFKLAVGPDGRPAGCEVTSSSNSETLDSTTCRLLMERARFEPARDVDGRAVADSFNGRIVWRLPNMQAMGRRDAAMTLWGVCLIGEAAKLALSNLSSEEIVRRSYAPCNALETLAAGEAGEPLDAKRREIVAAFEEIVFKARAVLMTTPRLIPPP